MVGSLYERELEEMVSELLMKNVMMEINQMEMDEHLIV